MRAAFDMDRKALVEETIVGREVECGVLGNDDAEASPVGEVIPSGEFYDYAAKYLEDSARLDRAGGACRTAARTQRAETRRARRSRRSTARASRASTSSCRRTASR